MMKKPLKILPPEDFDYIPAREAIITALIALGLATLAFGLTYLLW